MTTDPLSKAKAQLVLRHPFYAAIVLGLPLIADPDCPTAATDGNKIYYGPEFMALLNTDEQMFVLAHEVEHVVRLHAYRRGAREAKRFNYAADYIINDDLKRAGFTLPREQIIKVLYDPKYSGMYTEQVYELLASTSNDGQSGDGQPGDAAPPTFGGDDIRPASGTPAEQAQAQQTVQQAVHTAAAVARQAGRLPGHMSALLDSLLKPVVRWQDVLRRWLTATTTSAESWARLNRRLRHRGHRLPSRHSASLGDIAVILDTSGSCWPDIPQFVAEVASILQDIPPTTMHLIYTDTRVQRHEALSSVDDLDLSNVPKGGGTDLRVAFDYIDQHDIDPAVCLVLTDGETPHGDAPDYPVLWVLTQDCDVPWGETVRMEKENG